MKITVFHDERVLGRALAVQIAASLAAKPDLVLGLPTGRTTIRLYHELGAMHAKGLVDFSRADTSSPVESIATPSAHPGSYRAFMEQHLFSRVNLSPERINV